MFFGITNGEKSVVVWAFPHVMPVCTKSGDYEPGGMAVRAHAGDSKTIVRGVGIEDEATMSRRNVQPRQ